MKVSDYIAEFIAAQGIGHVFGITGGASIHMLHSVAKHPKLKLVPLHHEQACAMAADGYARINGLGCAIATSGPGATNMLTGIAGAYFDSIPVIYITGQVVRSRFRGSTGVRQLGFQETDIVSMVKPITKRSTQILDAEDVPQSLDFALRVALHGRPGPVLLDIPDDLQREEIDQREAGKIYSKRPAKKEEWSEQLLALIRNAERPVMILGHGVRLAGAEQEALRLAERLSMPICPTWGAMDIVPNCHPLFIGGFGINGSRAGNYAVQNSDCLLVIGSRLSTRETGTPTSSFARYAKIIMVDIDCLELGKFSALGKHIDLEIHEDAMVFCKSLGAVLGSAHNFSYQMWQSHIHTWKNEYPPGTYRQKRSGYIDPYDLMDCLSDCLDEDDIIVCDTGNAVAWAMQGLCIRAGQRFIHDFNNTAMGWALPAAIGAAYASTRRVVCIVGDGSIMMNLQELANIKGLDIKIILINNMGYSMVRQTQEEWLGSDYVATSLEGGLNFPLFTPQLSDAFFIPSCRAANDDSLKEALKYVLDSPGPRICEVLVSSEARVWPKLVYGRPIEDQAPLLPRGEFESNMFIESLDVSKYA